MPWQMSSRRGDTFSQVCAKTLHIGEQVDVDVAENRTQVLITVKYVELAGGQLIPYTLEPRFYESFAEFGDVNPLHPHLKPAVCGELDRDVEKAHESLPVSFQAEEHAEPVASRVDPGFPIGQPRGYEHGESEDGPQEPHRWVPLDAGETLDEIERG